MDYCYTAGSTAGGEIVALTQAKYQMWLLFHLEPRTWLQNCSETLHFFNSPPTSPIYLWCSFPSRLKKNQPRIRWGEWIRIKLFSSLIVKWWRKELVSTNYAVPHPPFNCTSSILTLLVTAFIFQLVGRSNSSKHLNHWKRPSVQIIHKIIAQKSQWNKPPQFKHLFIGVASSRSYTNRTIQFLNSRSLIPPNKSSIWKLMI